MAGKKQDLSGKQFGKLTVVSIAERKRDRGGASRIWWKCKCECGNECVIRASALTKKTGFQQSCGCLRHKGNPKHGLYHTRLHKIWSNMKTRCLNPNSPRYKDYGGRGITICEEWQEDFISFYSWAIEHGYREDLTIDRINNDGNYEPSNCRWADSFMQRRNRKDTHLISYNGETLTAKEWSKKIGGNDHLVGYRLRAGWDEIRAITTPPTKRRKCNGKAI